MMTRNPPSDVRGLPQTVRFPPPSVPPAAIASFCALPNPTILPTIARQFTIQFDRPPLGRTLDFAAGRLCAREALYRLSPPLADVEVGRTQRGVPVWPSGVVGSITHAAGVASAAVAWSHAVRSIGIDCEQVMSAQQKVSIANIVASPLEIERVREAGWGELEAVTLVFSAKEAVFKCLFPLVGRTFEFHDVELVQLHGPTCTFGARIVNSLSTEFREGTLLQGRFEVVGSLVHTGLLLLV